MEKLINKGKNVIEICIIFCIMIIGISKGGYYKLDSLGFMYLIDLFILIYLLLLSKIKVSKKVVIPFLALVVSYFLNIIFGNFATLSGSINIATRIYSMYLLYIVITNSRNKEWYLKAILLFAIICTLLLLDEMGPRFFSVVLNFLGSNYVSEIGEVPETIFQYSNILGLICLIAIVYLYKKLNENKDNNFYTSLCIGCISFLTLGVLLTHSKMVLVLYVIFSIYLPIATKNKRDILWLILNLVFSIIMVCTNSFVCALSFVISAIYTYAFRRIVRNIKIRNIVNAVAILIGIIICVLLFGLIQNTSMYLNFKNYFSNFESTTLRLMYFIDGIKIVLSNPLNFFVGMGGNAFRTMYETVQTTSYISLETHSVLIQIFVESGMIGLISFIILIINSLKSSTNIIYRFILVITIVFASFDVFFTYTIMLYILTIILGLNTSVAEMKNVSRRFCIYNIVMYLAIIIILTAQVIAMFLMPSKVDDLNITLAKQEKIISRCKIANILDFGDLSYIRKYNNALSNYIDIMDIQKTLYNRDDIEKRIELVSIIYDNLILEKKVEKSNKYVFEDNIYGIYKNVDILVQANYLGDEATGYERYLNEIVLNLEELKDKHSFNDYAIETYNEALDNIYNKFIDINTMLNNSSLSIMLDNIKEMAI